jgi:NAD(P)H-dependent FMN reductase
MQPCLGSAMLSTLALLASSRRHGNTGQLTDRIARELGVEVIDLGALRLSAYDYEHRNRDDDFEPLMRRVLPHAQLILATPVYWYAVSPPMKIFLDRISDLMEIPQLLPEGRRLRGKNAYVVCTSVCEEPAAEFLGAWRQTFSYLGMHFNGVAHVNCRDGLTPALLESAAAALAERVREARAAPAQD